MTRGLFDLQGKAVLATGSNSGIGLGFLQGCARHGASVVVWGRRMEKNAEAMKTLQALGAPRMHTESVDCVFANAGFSQRAPSFSELTSQMYLELLGVALHGGFYTLRAAARYMRERALTGDPGGSLVACGSLSLFHGYLASAASQFQTGTLLIVDGGRSVKAL